MAGKRSRSKPEGNASSENAARPKRSRRAAKQAEDQDVPEGLDVEQMVVVQEDPAAANQEQPEGGADRRQGMADLARRRAAHFAHFQAEDDRDDEDNVHVGGNTARTLGPWSSAVELAEKRAEVTAAREEKLLEAKREAGRATGPKWTPRRDPALGARVLHDVPSLFDTCVALVVEYIEDVETLWGLPDAIKVRIAEAVCERRKLSSEAGRLFTEGAPGDVVLHNCAQLDAHDMTQLLTQAATPRLEKLLLFYCGRGLTNKAVRQVMKGGKTLGCLTSLVLRGAYQLSDEGLECVVSKAPELTELRVHQSPNISGSLLEKLPALTRELRVLDLSGCRAVSASCLTAAFQGLPHLHTLGISGLLEVNDQLLVDAALALPGLRHVDCSYCSALSDTGLHGMAVARPQLQELKLDEVSRITDATLLSLAEHCKDLQVLSLRNCPKLSDEACAAVAGGCNIREIVLERVVKVGALTLNAMASFGRERLELVDLSWCRSVTDDMLGLLVDSCACLRHITLWGCSQVTDKFLHGHCNDILEVIGRGEVAQDVNMSVYK